MYQTDFESWLRRAQQYAYETFHRDWPVEPKDLSLCFDEYFMEGIEPHHAVEQELGTE